MFSIAIAITNQTSSTEPSKLLEHPQIHLNFTKLNQKCCQVGARRSLLNICLKVLLIIRRDCSIFETRAASVVFADTRSIPCLTSARPTTQSSVRLFVYTTVRPSDRAHVRLLFCASAGPPIFRSVFSVSLIARRLAAR